VAVESASIAAETILIDDGSSDGTAEAVRAAFPSVTVLRGNGSLFWNRAMRVAFAHALAQRFDYYLWLNDDVELERDAILRMIATEAALEARLGRRVIVVGSTWDPRHQCTSYGGYIRPRHLTLRHRRVEPDDVPLPCDTMTGNCVLIPHQVAASVGNLDPAFVQRLGDLDYGLRARRLGIGIWVAPGYVATCVNDNTPDESETHRSMSVAARLAQIGQPKALPPKPWLVFTRRHAGMLWPLLWASPYLKVIWRSIWRTPRECRSPAPSGAGEGGS
jgi:GT2 family glycosyltransferase